MFKRIIVAVSAAVLGGLTLAAAPVHAQALKGAGTCNDEYKANKAALKAAREKKGDFISACRALPLGTPTPIGSATPGAAPARNSDVGTYKTAGQCDDEYKQAKAALKAAKESKREFVAACRSLPPGTPTPINGSAAAPGSAPANTAAPVPYQPPSQPATRPAPTTTQRAPEPNASTTPSGANQFSTEAAAKSRCPGQTVVWLNTKSGVYHYAGKKNYGNTKAGAYMCETDATAAGDRAAKNGQ